MEKMCVASVGVLLLLLLLPAQVRLSARFLEGKHVKSVFQGFFFFFQTSKVSSHRLEGGGVVHPVGPRTNIHLMAQRTEWNLTSNQSGRVLQVVRGQGSDAPNGTMANATVTPTVSVNTTQEKNGCGGSGSPPLLLPLALAASILHRWSQ